MSTPGEAPREHRGVPTPVSVDEYTADTEGDRVPAPSLVREDVWVLPQPIASAHPPHYTLSYLVRDTDGGATIVDPGVDDDQNLERLLAHLSSIGSSGADLRAVVATHLHHDHLGLAERLRTEFGVPVAVGRAEQEALFRLAEQSAHQVETMDARTRAWGVPPEFHDELHRYAVGFTERNSRNGAALHADLLLDDGALLDAPGRRIRVLDTPGHTPGHIVLRDEVDQLLFTGDHLLPSLFPGIGLGGAHVNPIGSYLHSLDLIQGFDGHEALPGHGYRFLGLGGRIDATRAHHLKRSREVRGIRAELPDATVWQIASRIGWTAGWESLHGLHLMSALAQTAMHIELVTAEG